MSYSRFSDSNWYIFWYADTRFDKHQERLACWYASQNDNVDFDNYDNMIYDYLTIKKVIEGDWSIIDPKSTIPKKDRDFAVSKMKIWIKEVDDRWNRKGSK